MCDIDKETGSIKFIHAAFNGGVRYDLYPEGRYYKERFVCAGRVLPSSLESKIDTTLQDSTKEWIDKGSETIVVENNEKRDTITTPIVPIVKKDSITIHTIEKGDNLYRLSKKYGTTVEKIKEANGLKTNNLKIGSTLKIEYKKEEK